MKIVVAMDSWKGSLSSMEAGNAVKRGILRAKPDWEVVVKAAADGGEGVLKAIVNGRNGSFYFTSVTGPEGRPVKAAFGILQEGNTAVIEIAEAAGIGKIYGKEKNPYLYTTYGVGELIKEAIKRGCTTFIIGLGGSGTNDGGLGMLCALGYQFLDQEGKSAGRDAQALARIASVCGKEVLPDLKKCKFYIACDVDNPLLGSQGATYIYGPQKGVKKEQLDDFEAGMRHFAELTARFTGEDKRKVPGSGAAGGLGFAFLNYLNGKLVKGARLVLETSGIEQEIKDADYVITGEGRLDGQTLNGKTPLGVAELAQKYGKKVIAFAGAITGDVRPLNQAGITAFFPVIRKAARLEEIMRTETAAENLEACAEQVFRLL